MNQYLKGTIPLNVRALIKFANFFKVSPSDIFPEMAAEIGVGETPPQYGSTALQTESPHDLNLSAVEFAFQAFRDNIDWADREAGGASEEARLFDMFYRYYVLALAGGRTPDPASEELATIIKLNR